jgi:hypothetical protein
MINLVVNIETLPRALTPCGVRRVDKENGIRVVKVVTDPCQSIPVEKSHPFLHRGDRKYPPSQGSWIPPGRYSAPILALLDHARAWGHDPASIDPIAQYRLKRKFTSRFRGMPKSFQDIASGNLKIDNPSRQPTCVPTKDGMPYSGYILVQLPENDLIGQILRGNGK